MTERTAELYNNLIINVWGVPSYLAAAADYQDFLDYSAADGTPPFWLARGSAQAQVIEPLEAKLAAAGVEIVRDTRVVSATCAEGRVRRSSCRWTRHGGSRRAHAHEAVDELVLAAPTRRAVRARALRARSRSCRASPRLAEVARLGAQNVPLVHVYFKRKLHVPRGAGRAGGLVARPRLHGHLADLARRERLRGTDRARAVVLGPVRASRHGRRGRRDGRSSTRPPATSTSTDADSRHRLGPHAYESNDDTTLLVNETGTDVWRPKAADERLGNLSYAGDFTATTGSG